jgi:hypothetical protein
MDQLVCWNAGAPAVCRPKRKIDSSNLRAVHPASALGLYYWNEILFYTKEKSNCLDNKLLLALPCLSKYTFRPPPQTANGHQSAPLPSNGRGSAGTPSDGSDGSGWASSFVVGWPVKGPLAQRLRMHARQIEGLCLAIHVRTWCRMCFRSR